MAIEVNGAMLETDNEGFLLDPAEWDMDVAHELRRRRARHGQLPASPERIGNRRK